LNHLDRVVSLARYPLGKTGDIFGAGNGAEKCFWLGELGSFRRAKKLAGLGADVVFHTLRQASVSGTMSAGRKVSAAREPVRDDHIAMTVRWAFRTPENGKRTWANLDVEVGAIITKVPYCIAVNA
jgi:hypothetical protein